MKAIPRTRMFVNLGDEHIQLETIDVTESTSATNLRFRDTS